MNNTDIFKAYLRDVGRYPLLTHEETINLFQEMRDTIDDKRRDEIRTKLVNSNLRLVISIAKKYRGQGVDMIDLIQEGSCGLIEGIKRFNPDLGYHLGTYATHWIKQAIRRHLTGTEQLAGCRTVRLPSHIVALLPRIREIRAELAQELGYDPDAELIAERLDVTFDSVSAALDACGSTVSIDLGAAHNSSENEWSVSKLERHMRNSVNSEHEIEDLDDQMLSKQLKDIVRRSFSQLTPREEQVLRLRFGVMEDPDSDAYAADNNLIEELDGRVKEI